MYFQVTFSSNGRGSCQIVFRSHCTIRCHCYVQMGENFDSYECEQVRCSLPLVIINAKQAWKEKERVLTLFLTPFSGSGSGYRVRRRNHPSVVIISTAKGGSTGNLKFVGSADCRCKGVDRGGMDNFFTTLVPFVDCSDTERVSKLFRLA